MTAPRMILPDRFYMVTRRCSQRMFLLRPDPQSNQRFLYCLIEAANRWGITVVLPSVMSNHHHTIIYDRQGHVIEFMQHFHSILARSMNALRGRWENFFSTEEPSLVELVDRNDILDKLTYAATNPVQAGLVERVADWPGVNGLDALLCGRLVKVLRPEKFFRETGEMPEHVEHTFQVPKDTQRIGDIEQFLNELRESVARTEAEFARSGRRRGDSSWGDEAYYDSRGASRRRVRSPGVDCGRAWRLEVNGRDAKRSCAIEFSSKPIEQRARCGWRVWMRFFRGARIGCAALLAFQSLTRSQCLQFQTSLRRRARTRAGWLVRRGVVKAAVEPRFGSIDKGRQPEEHGACAWGTADYFRSGHWALGTGGSGRRAAGRLRCDRK